MLRSGLAILAVLLFAGPSSAVIMSITRYGVDFTKPDEAKAKAAWSDPDTFQVTPQGLGSTDHGSRRFWLQTTEPIGLGVSWRPTTAADLHVTVKGPGEKGQLYARYSADAQHWTTWQPLEADPTPALAETSKGPAQTFKGIVRVPYREHEKYGELLSAYSRRQDVPWVSDEEAAVKDILKTDPKFFERQAPFVGYVQFLYEADLPAGQRIQGMEVEAYWGVGGLHAIPKDPAVKRDRDGPWRFRAGR